MKTVTGLAAILWGLVALYSIFRIMTYALDAAPSMALFNAILWMLTKVTMAVFFYLLWKKQS